MTRTNKKIGLCLLAALHPAKRFESIRSLAAMITLGLFFGLLVTGCAHHQVPVASNPEQVSNPKILSPEPQPVPEPHPKHANFERESCSRNAHCVADWVVDSGDNCGMPFAIVDKPEAKVFVFFPDGRLRGAAPALLGLARGDDTAPGIGDKKMSEIRVEERTTPAGRFVASLGLNFHGKDILWVDYESAVSLHRVVTSNPKERRLERLATPTTADNRISFGCINVPVAFFNDVVSPSFTGTYGIVYVLPDVRPIGEVFVSYYDVESRWGTGKTADVDEKTKSVSRQDDRRVGVHKAIDLRKTRKD